MDLIVLLLVIGIIGFAVYLIVTYIPMPDIFKTVIIIFAAILLLLYLIRILGIAIPNVIR